MANPPYSDMPDTAHAFLMAHLPDGRTLLDFRRPIGHLILTDEEALNLAEGLAENVRMKQRGKLILPDHVERFQTENG